MGKVCTFSKNGIKSTMDRDAIHKYAGGNRKWV